MSERAESGYARLKCWPVKRIVRGVGVWCCIASVAARRCLSIRMLVDDLTYQPKYTPYNVSYYNFSWLG